MLLRNCAGGIVFSGNQVFLLKNEKDEWVLPKGIIREGELSNHVAVNRVLEEAGIKADIVSTAGRTNYEFFSVTRQRPVCNRIIWYIMDAKSKEFSLGEPHKFSEGGFFSIEDAIEKVTYSQDKALVNLSYKKYLSLIGEKEIA